MNSKTDNADASDAQRAEAVRKLLKIAKPKSAQETGSTWTVRRRDTFDLTDSYGDQR